MDEVYFSCFLLSLIFMAMNHLNLGHFLFYLKIKYISQNVICILHKLTYSLMHVDVLSSNIAMR